MTETEIHLRQELAACYRLIAHFRMTDLIFTHISVRIPGPEHHFLINPYGLMFDEISASNLVKIDLQGKAVRRRRTRSTRPVSLSTVPSMVPARMPSACCTPTPRPVARWRRSSAGCCR